MKPGALIEPLRSRLRRRPRARGVWVDHDWGLRYYLESEGALAVPRDQTFAVGDVVVTSRAIPERTIDRVHSKFARRFRCACSL